MTRIVNSKPGKFSILFLAKKYRLNPEGLAPIWVRITVDGQRAHMAVGKNLPPDDWNQKRQLPSNDPAYRELKEFILDLKAKIKIQYFTLLGTHKHVTAQDVKDSFRGIEVSPPGEMLLSVLSSFSAKQEERYRTGSLTFSRYRKWEQLWNTCRLFMKSKYHVADMSILKVKPYFADDLYHYLMTVNKLHQNTAMKRIKDLKQVMEYAVSREYIALNPFRSFKCILVPTSRTKLTTAEIQKVLAKEFEDIVLDEVRDCFLFAIYTGYSYKELSELTPENVQTGIDHRQWIIKTRSKSHNSKENVPLLPVPLKIIDKYQQHPECIRKNKLLPVDTNVKYNVALKELARACGIAKRLTTHVARHTFATTIMLENKVPLETVSKMLGHRDLKTTLLYAEMTDIRISEDTLDLERRLM